MAYQSSTTIEELRSYRAEAQFAPTLEQIRGIVDGLNAVATLDAISMRTGLATDEVSRVVIDLGTWLAKSQGSADVSTELAKNLDQLVLFQLPVRGSSTSARQSRKRRREILGVIIPEGFEPSGAQRRDFSKSLSAIVAWNPDDSTLGRFRSRMYTVHPKKLSFPYLTYVAFAARHGRLDKDPDSDERLALLTAGAEHLSLRLRRARALQAQLKQEAPVSDRAARWLPVVERVVSSLKESVNRQRAACAAERDRALDGLLSRDHARGGSQEQVAAVLVEAYDLLEVARGDAVDAISTLLRGTASVNELIEAAKQAAILDDHIGHHLLKKLEFAKERPGAQQLVQNELKVLAGKVELHPEHFRPEHIGQLSPVQVRRIGARAGLVVEDDSANRSSEHQVRQRLRELGLERDADQLVGLGVRAMKEGTFDDYESALESRVAGDPDWVEQLDAVFAMSGECVGNTV